MMLRMALAPVAVLLSIALIAAAGCRSAAERLPAAADGAAQTVSEAERPEAERSSAEAGNMAGDQAVSAAGSAAASDGNAAQARAVSAGARPSAEADQTSAAAEADEDLAPRLVALMVGVGGMLQPLWPAFDGEPGLYTSVVGNDAAQATIGAAAAGGAELVWRNSNGSPLVDADLEAAGLQVDLSEPGAWLVKVSAARGTDASSYSLLLVREAALGGEAPCAAGSPRGPQPAPRVVEVERTPIVVDSAVGDYFVLYVRGETADGAILETPAAVRLGEAGTTVLTEHLATLPAERYRVERYQVAAPADVDGDCIDDIVELANPLSMNPLNPAPRLEHADGALMISDLAAFAALSYKQEGAPAGFESVKFVLLGMDTDRPRAVFMNSGRYRYHEDFRAAFGLAEDSPEMISGTIIRHPNVKAANGNAADYHYEFWPYSAYPFALVERAQTVLAASMPLLHDNLAYYAPPAAISTYRREQARYDASRVDILFDEQLTPESGYIALNAAVGYGLLRAMKPDERPNPRDVAIYETLPNDLSRVAGIISSTPQTPLSHVNLRAISDGAPNAFIRGALDQPEIRELVGGYVRYAVTTEGWSIRAATVGEVEAHYASSRPAQVQTPQRDLSVRSITPLGQVAFEDWTAFGVKAANLAVLGRLGFPPGTVPDGFAVPFYFYDEFMKHNGLYAAVEALLADSAFREDLDVQADALRQLRREIRAASMPQWMMDALAGLQESFPIGTSIRCRSSTNNEDLPGFSGAGLYDSRTQHPDEGHMAKCIKQVYASLWNFRAFAEREFQRIDHLATAMAVLTHPNYSDEQANGVAVTYDPIYGSDAAYYVNTQLGEDLVTNPEALSIPEEVLLREDGEYTVVAASNQAPPGRLLLGDEQFAQLRAHLEVVHEHFAALYEIGPGERFAMEVEFKITSEGSLAIKQARPWIFGG